MDNILGLLLLATLVESFTEYAFGKIERLQPFLMYISLLLGVGASVAYKVDILAMFDLHANLYVNYVVSGLIIGRGSNYLNDFISSFGKNRTTVTSDPETPTETTVKVTSPT